MQLKKLLQNIRVKKIIGEIDEVTINSLNDNFSKPQKDSLFFAIKGLRVDAHNFIKQALLNGAAAVVVEKQLEVKVPQIIVENSRVALSKIAGNFYQETLKKLNVISVIGTNGKTTTTYFIKSILEAAGKKVGVIGTSGIFIQNKKYSAHLTTPDTLELFDWFQKMVVEEVEYVVIEISAHSIALNKINGFKSRLAVFTNFSSEHLDYFKTMEEYKNTKIRYFTTEFCEEAVVNVDDKVGVELLKKINLPTATYSLTKKASASIKQLKTKLNSSSFTLLYENKEVKIALNIGAKFNVYNALGASLACLKLGITLEEVKKGLEGASSFNGRFNITTLENNCSVVIDYAHTTLAIKEVLKALKKQKPAKLICVLGAPGNRDQLKRKDFGRVVSQYCDYAILTSDNPDTENPLLILNQIKKGFQHFKNKYEIIEDRDAAIKRAFALIKNQNNSIIVLLGKGSEEYQIINSVKVPYNDDDVVKKIIR